MESTFKTPRTIIQDYTKGRSTEKSLHPSRTRQPLTRSPQSKRTSDSLTKSPAAKKSRSSSFSEVSEKTPRQLITGFLTTHSSTLPLTRHQSRVNASVEMLPPSTQRKSAQTRRRSSLGIPRMDEFVKTFTPRTAIQGLLSQAVEETPVTGNAEARKSQTLHSLPGVDSLLRDASFEPLHKSFVGKVSSSHKQRQSTRHRRPIEFDVTHGNHNISSEVGAETENEVERQVDRDVVMEKSLSAKKRKSQGKDETNTSMTGQTTSPSLLGRRRSQLTDSPLPGNTSAENISSAMSGNVKRKILTPVSQKSLSQKSSSKRNSLQHFFNSPSQKNSSMGNSPQHSSNSPSQHSPSTEKSSKRMSHIHSPSAEKSSRRMSLTYSPSAEKSSKRMLLTHSPSTEKSSKRMSLIHSPSTEKSSKRMTLIHSPSTEKSSPRRQSSFRQSLRRNSVLQAETSTLSPRRRSTMGQTADDEDFENTDESDGVEISSMVESVIEQLASENDVNNVADVAGEGTEEDGDDEDVGKEMMEAHEEEEDDVENYVVNVADVEGSEDEAADEDVGKEMMETHREEDDDVEDIENIANVAVEGSEDDDEDVGKEMMETHREEEDDVEDIENIANVAVEGSEDDDEDVGKEMMETHREEDDDVEDIENIANVAVEGSEDDDEDVGKEMMETHREEDDDVEDIENIANVAVEGSEDDDEDVGKEMMETHREEEDDVEDIENIANVSVEGVGKAVMETHREEEDDVEDIENIANVAVEGVGKDVMETHGAEGDGVEEVDDVEDEEIVEGHGGARDRSLTQKSHTDNKQRSVGDNAQKKKKPRKSPEPYLPISTVRGLFNHFSRAKVSKEAIAEVVAVSGKFWKSVAGDLEMYAKHAGRKTIMEEDVELLMRRQGFISDKKSLNTLVHQYLPLELREQILPIARSGNKIELNRKYIS